MSRRRWPRSSRLVGCAIAVLVAGCGTGHPQPSLLDGSGSVASLSMPSLIMANAQAGYAVWPSGPSWLLLATRDGWRNVQNVTPPAVPTGGGLAVGLAAGHLAVGVGPYDRLSVSPVLSSSDPATSWTPAQLPAAIADSAHAVALDGARLTAISVTGPADGGSLLRRDSERWDVLTTAKALSAGGGIILDSISWANGGLGWLTGHGPAGTTIAYLSRDDGRTWAPISGLPAAAVAGLTPCGAGSNWQLPIVTADHRIRVLRSTDAGGHWVPGATLASATATAWSCQADTGWLLGSVSGTIHLFVSNDSGTTWSDRGATPAGISALYAGIGQSGLAAGRSQHQARLWAVTVGGDAGTASYRELPLPKWVGTIGGSGSSS